MTDDEMKRLDWILSKAEDAAPGALSERDWEFLDNMLNRRERSKDRMVVSEAQWAWLEDIAERAA